jgi:hypothetical protein
MAKGGFTESPVATGRVYYLVRACCREISELHDGRAQTGPVEESCSAGTEGTGVLYHYVISVRRGP